MLTTKFQQLRKIFGLVIAAIGLSASIPSAYAVDYVAATGGTLTTYQVGATVYNVHTFTGNGTFTVTSANGGTVNYLVIAGGGGGGGFTGGGGGAGGFLESTATVTGGNTAYTVTVGTGGPGGTGNGNPGGFGTTGGNSVFGSFATASGGGGGAPNLASGAANGKAGGSGGGASWGSVVGTGGAATSGQGNAGGACLAWGGPYAPGGGGGAGAVGVDGNKQNPGANGGAGKASSITGTSKTYAGGGGGGSYNNTGGTGGTGGGGNGGSGGVGTAGTANTGGGGGGQGGNNGSAAATGGSGIVIISYVSQILDPNAPSSTSATLAVSENTATALTTGNFGYTDPNSSPLTAVQITTLPALGTLKLSGTAVTLNQIVAVADIPNLTYQSALPTYGTGAAYTTIGIKVENATSLWSAAALMTVNVTPAIIVQDPSFETPVAQNGVWAAIAAVWNSNIGNFAQTYDNSRFATRTDAGTWYANLTDAGDYRITQNFSTTVTSGDTLAVTFYVGRELGQVGGVMAATFKVGTTPYTQNFDTTGLTAGTWQSYTLTQTIANTGTLALQFNRVSGRPWLDNISNVSRTPGVTTYTVTFDNNTGSGTMTAQTGSSAAALTANTFTKTGYTFAGWNTVAGGGGTAYADGASYAFTASTTLYAQWTINGYTVTFDNNTGSGTMTAQTGSSATPLTSNTFTKTGYTFAGWNTVANGTGTAYANGASYAFTASTTLYAQWTPTPTITLADTLAAVNTTYGTASATPTFFHVSGSALTGNLTVTPPTGYEVSLSSGSGYTTSLSITASGTLASTQVYVRLAATSGVAGSPYSGNITVSGGGASSQIIATASSTVAKADATVVVTPYTVNYDGNPHSATVTSITGVNGETGATVGTVTLNTTHTDAGIYNADSWSFTPTANYNDIGTSTTSITVANGNFETEYGSNTDKTINWVKLTGWSLENTSIGKMSISGNFSSDPDGGSHFTRFTWNDAGAEQDLSTNVSAGDTLSVTFNLGVSLGAWDQDGSRVKGNAYFKVGSTYYKMPFDLTGQTAGVWYPFTFTTTINNSGNLSIGFQNLGVANNYYTSLDGVGNVSRTSGSGTQTLTDRINNLPTSTGGSVTMKLNTTNTFAASDFKFADGDVVDTLSAVKVVTSLPTHGTLKLNGTSVALGDVIPVADIGALTYTPTAGYTGADSFKFQVSDGIAYSADATMAITVTPPKGTMVSFFDN